MNMQIEKDEKSNTLTVNETCPRCQKNFQSQIPNRSTETKWSVIETPRYCLGCEASREETLQAFHHDELKRSFSQSELEGCQSQAETDKILSLPMQVLQERLRKGEEIFSPLDWWHVHYEKVLKHLSAESWSTPRKSVLIEKKCGGEQLVPWLTSLATLPFSALLDLFSLGEVRIIANALGRLRCEHSEKRQELYDMAKARLVDSEPRARFEALYVLLLLKPNSSLADCIRIAGDEQEHFRVRGLALEGISEAFDVEGPLAEEILDLLERLPQSSSPEIRWWSAYAIGHLPQIYDSDGKLMNDYHIPLLEALESIADDPRPAGLGWAVGKEAQDAIALWQGQGQDPPERPRALPYDPWGVV